MSNYATLISAIQSVIKENGNNEITGAILQQTLLSMINSLGSGYQFVGIATPETNPGTPDQRVFYLASSGTYPNFGPETIPSGNLAVFYYDTSWHYSLCEITAKFASGEEVTHVSLVDNLIKGGSGNVLTAEQGAKLGLMVGDVDITRTPVTLVTSGAGQNVFPGFVAQNGVIGGTTTSSRYLKISCVGIDKINFLGVLYKYGQSPGRGYAFLDADSNVLTGGAHGYDVATDSSVTENTTKDYIVPVPSGASYFITNVNYSVLSDLFYCNTIVGESLSEEVDSIKGNVTTLQAAVAPIPGIQQDVTSLSKLKLDKSLNYSSQEYGVGESYQVDFYIDSNGKYASRSNSLVVIPVKQGYRFVVTGHATRNTRVCFVSSISNLAVGNSPTLMEGESIVNARNTTVDMSSPGEGYFLISIYDGGATSYPQVVKRFLPIIPKAIGLDNLKKRTLVAEGTATSSTSENINIIQYVYNFQAGMLSQPIPAGTKLIFTISGLSNSTTRSLRYLINDSQTVQYLNSNGESVIVFNNDISRIRVYTATSEVVAASEVSVKIEIADVGELLESTKKLDSIVDVSKQSFIDVAGDGYDSTNDKFLAGTYNVYILASDMTAQKDIIVNYLARYTSNDASVYPYISVRYIGQPLNITSKVWKYPIGGKGFYKFGQCKCIGSGKYPYIVNNVTYSCNIEIRIVIPSGCELFINNIGCELSSSFINKNAFKVYQHGTERMADACTKTNWDLWTHIGNYGAIVIPKRTTDGVWVCYHDDSFGESPNVQVIGSPSASLPAASMQACTYAQTQTLEYKNTNVYGNHDTIPKLEDFFAKCAQMGVHPCLSCHPVSVSESAGSTWKYAHWSEVRDMAKKYKLLDKLTIKSSISIENNRFTAGDNFYNIFGNDIEGAIFDVNPTGSYTGSASQDADIISKIDALDLCGWDKDKVKVGIELVAVTMYFSDDILAYLKTKNMVHGIAPGGSSDAFYRYAENLKKLIEKGCYEITADQFYSNGLNWA